MIGQLDWLNDQLEHIERCAKDYVSLLSDEQQLDIVGARFIYLLETLRIENDRLEIKRNFPQTIQQIQEWQNDYGTEDQFKPKVIDLCRNIKQDLKDLFTDHQSIYSVPYRIGVIGHTSVGKSALILKLAQLVDYASMINLERSTFGYLQFDVRIDDPSTGRTIPISFIDIAGSIDNDASRSIGNYLELITNANCDVYMLVFDKPFDAQNQMWLEYIEKDLRRKCLLVRSKSDVTFDEFYYQVAGEPYQSGTARRPYVQSSMDKVREHAAKTFESRTLSQRIYLTAAGRKSSVSNDMTIEHFDLEQLREELHGAARTDPRVTRVCRLAILASRTAINTCFRRGYVVSKIKFRMLAAGSSLIPFLDEISAFFGREEIRQAFGIHDRSSISNFFRGSKNDLEVYLSRQSMKIPKGVLQSGCFKYLVDENSEGSNAERIAEQYLSIVTTLVKVAVILVVASWSFYLTGKRMDRHLHLLCDDLQKVLLYFIHHHSEAFCQNNPA